MYGPTETNQLRHHSVGDANVWNTATTALGEQGAFTFTAAADAAGPTQVLTRSASAEVSLIVRYRLE